MTLPPAARRNRTNFRRPFSSWSLLNVNSPGLARWSLKAHDFVPVGRGPDGQGNAERVEELPVELEQEAGVDEEVDVDRAAIPVPDVRHCHAGSG
jgi:hypothetical protein